MKYARVSVFFAVFAAVAATFSPTSIRAQSGGGVIAKGITVGEASVGPDVVARARINRVANQDLKDAGGLYLFGTSTPTRTQRHSTPTETPARCGRGTTFPWSPRRWEARSWSATVVAWRTVWA